MPPTPQPTGAVKKNTFRADMLGRRQKRQLEQTGTFRDRRGLQRDAQGRVTTASQNAPRATNQAQPASTTTRTPSDALRAFSVANAPAPIESPVPADMVQPTADLDLPSPQAPAVQEQFITSLSDQVANTRATFENQVQTRRDEIAAERATLEQERDRILETDVAKNLKSFRERLEKTERERLFVNENFEANQRLTNELDNLLTEGNNLIRYQQGLPAAQRVVDARVNNAMRDVAARAGVIEAVISARNSQIAQAYTMIDRTVAAITADRNDQLNYYGALLNVKEQGLLKLSKEDEQLANEQLTLAKRDMEQAQATADYIKTLMIDPETAQFVADAGVTMLDSVETINQKLASQTERRQVEATKNQYVEAGYEYVPFPTDDMQGLTTVEVNGQQLSFRVRPGSPLAMEMEQARLQQEATRASIANIYDQIQARRDAIAEAAAKATAPDEKAQLAKIAETEQALEIRTLANQLLNADGMSAAVGFGLRKSVVGSIPFMSGDAIAGTSRADFEAKAERLSNLLTLDNLKLMSGVLTDRDIQLLATAGSNLSNLNMSEEAYTAEVNRIIGTVDRTIANNGLTPEQALFWGVLESEDDAATLDSLWDAL